MSDSDILPPSAGLRPPPPTADGPQGAPEPARLPEREAMAWPPATWERAEIGWRADVVRGVDPFPVPQPQFGLPDEHPELEEDRALRKHERQVFVRELLETGFLTLLIFFGIRMVVQNFKIEGMSMEPTLHSGQYLLVNKLAYSGSGEPQRGDIVVFESWSPEKDFIKRVIGMPGETVEVKDNAVYINGDPIDEIYLQGQTSSGNDSLKLDENEYYVMGDNRGNSSDSRNHGAMDRDKIIGKAWIIYWPVEDLGFVKNGREALGSES